ncbi:hypothetical protein ACFOLL_02770 [Falsochrobactrum ovis]|uniref:ElaB/YqjD/DUF883 family membrane-anchored ribosome-binding protein n=1 Tax=Falsochrobactrum ovis TaxID=1293442 RepID=A0A364JYE7_9HYPH|nr:hypothetical protein [Falsochrobactrum ovis]RAK32318.1 hypothetical protein C7374_102324 [Falsochrobactrum ovis]
MAENKTANEIQRALEQQVADLRSELHRLTQSLASHSGEFRHNAENMIEDAHGRIVNVAQTMRERGQAVAETVKENPGTATTLFGTAGIIGILIGIAIGSALSDRR